jgi:hypothetical protein
VTLLFLLNDLSKLLSLFTKLASGIEAFHWNFWQGLLVGILCFNTDYRGTHICEQLPTTCLFADLINPCLRIWSVSISYKRRKTCLVPRHCQYSMTHSWRHCYVVPPLRDTVSLVQYSGAWYYQCHLLTEGWYFFYSRRDLRRRIVLVRCRNESVINLLLNGVACEVIFKLRLKSMQGKCAIHFVALGYLGTNTSTVTTKYHPPRNVPTLS